MRNKVLPGSVELWGGIECTINRVEDQYFDQLGYAGHYDRKLDIEKIASLGFKAMRYPVLWEHHQLGSDQEINWKRSAGKLTELKERGITPIVGLLHHGSGPAFTNLLDPGFPEKLALYASQVATAFPWVEYYTPVNEPLTTARFSGLYGLWYPHHQNDISFARMLLNQVRAIVLAMAAIRKVNPNAKLVQTEDLAKTYSTTYLSFQAAFENERRWLTYDLLTGTLKKGDKLWEYFTRLGISEKELLFFQQHPCPPDICGWNYYITSERFLDHNLKKHPLHTHGGNELQQYADVEAIRVDHGRPWGLKLLLEEAWQRYKLPLAITECHLNCTREEQLRWLKETWCTANDLRNEGVDIRAVTAWSVLGSFGWDRLLTGPEMNYEPGLFDIRSGALRETALAKLARAIAGNNPLHPLSLQPGWWHRLHHSKPISIEQKNAPLLIIGKTGTLGNAFSRMCKLRGLEHILVGRDEVDITIAAEITAIIERWKPWGIINTAGFVRVDDAEAEEAACYASNTLGPALLAKACSQYAIPFMTFSSDLVFDGSKQEAYHEDDLLNPVNVYGKTKAIAEARVLAENPGSLVIRTSAFFGPWDQFNFPFLVIRALKKGEPFEAASDIYISPTYLPDLVNHSLDLFIDGETGIRHLANKGAISWAEFAKAIAQRFGLDEELVVPVSYTNLCWKAARPQASVLTSNKELLMPCVFDAMDRYAMEMLPHKTIFMGGEQENQPLKI